MLIKKDKLNLSFPGASCVEHKWGPAAWTCHNTSISGWNTFFYKISGWNTLYYSISGWNTLFSLYFSKLCINFANKTALFSNNDPVMGADIFHTFFISVYMIPYPCVNYHIHKYAMVCTLYLQVPQCMVLQCRLNFAPWNLIPKSPVWAGAMYIVADNCPLPPLVACANNLTSTLHHADYGNLAHTCRL